MAESSWKKCEAYMNGVKITGLRGFTYEKESDDEPIYAGGDQPIAIQSGNVSYRGNLKAFKSDIDAMNKAAQAQGYNDITEVNNLVLVKVYKPEGQTLLQTDTLTGVKISKLTKGWDQGAKFMEIDLPYNFLNLKIT